jgi:hypothetical protein
MNDPSPYNTCNKVQRTRSREYHPTRYCEECKTFVGKHKPSCSKASLEDYHRAMEKALKDETWARKRAAFWLQQVTIMHGKLSMLKQENRKLRSKVASKN